MCPRLPTDFSALGRLLFDERDFTAEIGAVKAFFVARATDENIRRNAQHGGTVTALVDLALSIGLIDSAVLTTTDGPLQPVSSVVAPADQARHFGEESFHRDPEPRDLQRACERTCPLDRSSRDSLPSPRLGKDEKRARARESGRTAKRSASS